MAGKAGLAIRQQDRMSRRSNPEQKRSRARQRALLDAAEEILGEVGADGLKMPRSRAGRICRSRPSITTFRPPALTARWSSGCSTNCARSWRKASCARREPTPERRSTRCHHHRRRGRLHAEPPDLARRMGAMRGAPELRALDLADTEGNAQILAPAIGALLPRAPAEDAEAFALVIIEGVWGALQLGCELPPEKRPRVRAMLKEFVAAALAGLMEKYR